MEDQNKWKIEFNPFNPDYLEPMKFFFYQSEKNLQGALDRSDKVTNRSYLIFAACIPLATGLVSVLSRYYLAHEVSLQNIVPLCWLGMIAFFAVFLILLSILMPRQSQHMGSEPRRIARQEYFDNPKYNIGGVPMGQLSVLAYEIEDYQARISFMDKLNASRIKRFKLALWVIITGFLLAMAYISYFAGDMVGFASGFEGLDG